MAKTDRKTVAKELECVKCGQKLTLHRLMSRNKHADHIKHLYCIQCKTMTPHKELPLQINRMVRPAVLFFIQNLKDSDLF